MSLIYPLQVVSRLRDLGISKASIEEKSVVEAIFCLSKREAITTMAYFLDKLFPAGSHENRLPVEEILSAYILIAKDVKNPETDEKTALAQSAKRLVNSIENIINVFIQMGGIMLSFSIPNHLKVEFLESQKDYYDAVRLVQNANWQQALRCYFDLMEENHELSVREFTEDPMVMLQIAENRRANMKHFEKVANKLILDNKMADLDDGLREKTQVYIKKILSNLDLKLTGFTDGDGKNALIKDREIMQAKLDEISALDAVASDAKTPKDIALGIQGYGFTLGKMKLFSYEVAKDFTKTPEQEHLLSDITTLVTGLLKASGSLEREFIGPLQDFSRITNGSRYIVASYMLKTFPSIILKNEVRHPRHANVLSAVERFAETLDRIVIALGEGEFPAYEDLPGDSLIDFTMNLWSFIDEYVEWKASEKVRLVNIITGTMTTLGNIVQCFSPEDPVRINAEEQILTLRGQYDRLMAD